MSETSAATDHGPLVVSSTDLALLRDLVYRRVPAAAEQSAALQARTEALAARAELLAALAEANEDENRARARVMEAVRAVRELGLRDAETLLDVVFGLLVAARPGEAASVALQSVDDAASGTIQQAAVFVVIDRLTDAKRQDEADELLASVLRRVLTGGAPLPAPQEAPAPPPQSERRRLPRLFAVAFDAFERGREASRERMADVLLGSVLQQLALGGVSLESPDGAAVPAVDSQLLRGLLSRTEKRLASGPDNPQLRTLYAAALVMTGRLADGLRLADEVVAHESDDRQAQWVRIAALTRLGRYDDALAELEDVPESAFAAAQASALRVRLLTRAGRAGEAIDTAATALETATSDVGLTIARAEALAAAGRTDEALALLDVLQREQPEQPDVLTSRAELLHRLGRADEAIAVLVEVRDHDPRNVTARAALARLYEETGQGDRALDELDQALAVAPGRPDLLLERARLLRASGRFVEALQNVDEARGVGDTEPGVQALRGELLREIGRPDEALEAFLAAYRSTATADVDRASGFAESVEAVANDLLNERRYLDPMIAALQTVHEAGHLSALGKGILAEALRVNGRPKDAIAQADDAVAAGADAGWMAGTKADCLFTLGRSAEALQTIEPVVRDNPDYLFGQSARAQALDALGRVTEALGVVQDHLSDDPDWHAWAVSASGAFLLELGRLDEAVALLTDAHEQAGGNPWWLLQRGSAYHRLGRVQEAIESLRQGLAEITDEPPPWAVLELADSLTHARKTSPPEALELYERIAALTFDEMRPKSGVDIGWALMRLNQLEESLAMFASTFTATTDPMLSERVYHSAVLALSGDEPKAAAELDGALAAAAKLEDADRARGLAAEARYVIELIRDDDAWRSARPRIEALAGRLQSPVATD